jgi:SAM-dependent methyltransferase/GNAT superfamily N-acetyltransferase
VSKFRIRFLNSQLEHEVEWVASRMRQTLKEVLGEERGGAMYTMDWLKDRVLFHLNPSQCIGQIFIAEVPGDNMVGHCIVRVEKEDNSEIGLFSTTYVEPEFRRLGVAEALLSSGEAWMREQGMTLGVTYTDQANVKLIQLYEKRGYTLTQTYSEKAMIRLEKKLAETVEDKSSEAQSPLDQALRVKFNEVAREYEAVRPTYPDECINTIVKYANSSPSSKILEIGCGTGQATQFFVACGFSPHCIDIGEELVAIASEKFRSYPSVKIEVSSFEAVEIPRSRLDLIYSATAFHWIDPNVRYQKAAQLLKPDGTLALFWNIDTRKETELRLAIDEVYHKVIPSEPDDQKRQSDFEVATTLMQDQLRSA